MITRITGRYLPMNEKKLRVYQVMTIDGEVME